MMEVLFLGVVAGIFFLQSFWFYKHHWKKNKDEGVCYKEEPSVSERKV